MNTSDAMAWKADEADLYSTRQTVQENTWDSFYLSEGEKEYWRRQDLSVDKILTGVFTIVLSEILRNGIGTLAVVGGITILSMFILIPTRYRVLAQVWNYLPCVLVYIQNILDCRLIPFFGTYLTNMQFVPILYIITGGILSAAGFKIYPKYQVRAR